MKGSGRILGLNNGLYHFRWKMDCAELIQQHREVLLRWIEPNPAPLLRRLHDCRLLTQPEYFSLLETNPKSNQVIALLDRISQRSGDSQNFLEELRQLQDLFCPDLQDWLQKNHPEEGKEEPKEELPTSRPDGLCSANPAATGSAFSLLCHIPDLAQPFVPCLEA